MTVAQIAEMLQSDIVFSHPDRECRHVLHKALAMFSMAAMLQVCVCGWVARRFFFSRTCPVGYITTSAGRRCKHVTVVSLPQAEHDLTVDEIHREFVSRRDVHHSRRRASRCYF